MVLSVFFKESLKGCKGLASKRLPSEGELKDVSRSCICIYSLSSLIEVNKSGYLLRSTLSPRVLHRTLSGRGSDPGETSEEAYF